jgi:L-lactate dehydrogenase complex protein LldG
MTTNQDNPVLTAVRGALGRGPGSPLAVRPAVLDPRAPAAPDVELDRLLREITALSGVAHRVRETEIDGALERLVQDQGVRIACVWPTAGLRRLEIERRLTKLGVTIVPPNAGKEELARCDLGVTEADFALPETGTLGLLSSAQQPRAVSLLPRVHLAVLSPAALRADLHQVFTEAKGRGYLILISGPSRTADIELTVTLGVHGPKALHVWALAG